MTATFKIRNDGIMHCKFCNSPKKEGEQRWHLTDYHGFNGTCCWNCYQKISHDSYGNPNNPEEYLMMIMKHGK